MDHQRFMLRWEDMTVEVEETGGSFFTTNSKPKQILKHVSGSAISNSLIAVMGCSGSGKTTLIRALSGRIRAKCGVIKLNEQLISPKVLKNVSGYLQQDDIFITNLSAYEHMLFMAAMKVKQSEENRIILIKKLLNDLCLKESKDTLIKYLSGGQKRRLSLATELIDDPYILFCDEATTGLDSFSAITVIHKLQELASKGKIVLATIHQPSSQLFDLFDNIILLANGSLVFQGSKQGAKEFFECEGLVCPTVYNPADFYIKCTSQDAMSATLCDKFQRNHQYYENGFSNLCRMQTNSNNERYFKKCFFFELYWLMWRTSIDYRRNIYVVSTNMALILITAIIISLNFTSVTIDKESSVQSIQGALSLLITEIIFDSMYQVIYDFPREIDIFAKEKTLYSPCPYFLSKFFSTIPFCILLPLLFWLTYFIPLNFLKGFALFINVYLVLFATCICGTAFGLCLSALFPTVEYLNIVIMPYETMCMMLSGIWIRVDSIPKHFRVFKYFSPFFLSFQSVSTIYWENIEHLANCTVEDKLPCFENGIEVLEEYNLLAVYDNVILVNYLYLLGLTCLFCYIGYIGILRKRALYTD